MKITERKNRIFLIGFMGAGKTRMGKKLAKELRFSFIDVDEEIETKFQQSINEIFSGKGEDFFREEESKMLESILQKEEDFVISVGGGLPCFNDNMEVMNREGITVYLQRSPKELFQRLKEGKDTRPLIKDLNDEELLSYIEKMIDKRAIYYEKAQLKLDRNNQELYQMVTQLDALLNLK